MDPKKNLQTNWPLGLKSGDVVLHNGHECHVISLYPGLIQRGCVPVTYEDDPNCFSEIPADDIDIPPAQ